MSYMGDSFWWNNRFEKRDLKLMKPEKILVEDLKSFKKTGIILDLACGDGRNSVLLAEAGYEVLAVDFSSIALKRLSYFAKDRKLNICTKLLDLSKKESFEKLPKVKGIVINHYRLNPSLYGLLIEKLEPEGILWVNGFRKVPIDNPNIKEEDILREEDFKSLRGVIHKKLYEDGERKFLRLILKK